MTFDQQLDPLQMIRVVALDLDGVVYLGNTPLPGAVGAVQEMRAMGLRVYFVTNNSGKTRADIAAKLTDMGIPADENQVLTSGYAASMLVSRLSRRSSARVLVLGSDGLKAEISRQGGQVVTSTPCEFLVVGMDREFTYDKLCTALDALQDSSTFIACNRDASFPGEGGRLLPGCGPIVAAIECAAGRQPAYEAGKPSTTLLEMISSKDRVEPQQLLVIGDSIQSDIAMAHRFGAPSVLVALDGPEQEQETAQPPSLVVKSLADLPYILATRMGQNKSWQSIPCPQGL